MFIGHFVPKIAWQHVRKLWPLRHEAACITQLYRSSNMQIIQLYYKFKTHLTYPKRIYKIRTSFYRVKLTLQ